MFDVCRDVFPEIAWTPLRRLWSLDPSLADRGTRLVHRLANCRGEEVAVLGGGTLIGGGSPWIAQYLGLRERVRRAIPVFSPGVEDPVYAPGNTTWRAQCAAWVDALRDLPVVGVRGPRSLQLLREAGLKNVRMTGDPVLVMHRGLAPAASPARRMVAINAGRSAGRVWGDEETVLASLADAARRLHAAGWTVRFVPVWDEDEEVCRDVARRAGLSDADVEPLILDAREWIGLVRRFDVIVTLKLHAAVLAAVAGTPFVPLEYRPKVRDFCESIGWADHLMRTDDFTGERVARAVCSLYDDLPAARAGLRDRVESLAAEFHQYAAEVREMLLA
jgi:polysaccharide pyruvyl transferase WcaK-like protein